MSDSATKADNAPTAEQVAAMDERMGRWSVTALILIGVWLLLAPLAPTWSGWNWATSTMGGEKAVLRFFVAFLFLYFAGLVRDKNALRHTLSKFMAALKGKVAASQQEQSPDQLRHAVDLLIQGLKSEREEVRATAVENLKRLTGEDFGPNAKAWQSWWGTHRAHFKRADTP